MIPPSSFHQRSVPLYFRIFGLCSSAARPAFFGIHRFIFLLRRIYGRARIQSYRRQDPILVFIRFLDTPVSTNLAASDRRMIPPAVGPVIVQDYFVSHFSAARPAFLSISSKSTYIFLSHHICERPESQLCRPQDDHASRGSHNSS